MGLSLTDFTLATISGASCANLSSTRMTPSLVGMNATFPPSPTMTYKLSLTFCMVSGAGGFCDQASHRPANPRTAAVTRSTISFRINMERIYRSRVAPAILSPVGLSGTGKTPATKSPALPLQAGRAQRDREAAALPRRALHHDRASMQFHQAPGDGQSQASTLPAVAGWAAYLVKLVEDRLQIRDGNANSGVADTESRGILLACIGNPHPAILRGELYGVAQQVVEHLLEARPIGADRHADGHLVVDRNMFDLRQRPDHREHFLQGFGRAEHLAVQIDASGLDPGNIQQIVDDVQQVPGAFLNVGHKARVWGLQGSGGLFAQELGVAQNRVQRRTQFVAAAPQKIGLHPVDALHFPIALLQFGGRAFELRGPLRHPPLQIFVQPQDFLLRPLASRDVPSRGKYAGDLSSVAPIHRSVVENRGNVPIDMADLQFIVLNRAFAKGLLVPLPRPFPVREVVAEIRPDQFLARPPSDLLGGMVHVGDGSLRRNCDQRIQAGFNQAAVVGAGRGQFNGPSLNTRLQFVVRSPERLFGPLQRADVEVDPRPARNLSLFVADRHAARQDSVPLPVHAAIAVLDVPTSSRADALFPGGNGPRGIIRVQHVPPSEIGTLLLRHPHQLQERIAGISVAAVGGAHPYPVVDGFADGAVQPLALPQRLFRPLALGEIGVRPHDADDRAIRFAPDGESARENVDVMAILVAQAE